MPKRRLFGQIASKGNPFSSPGGIQRWAKVKVLWSLSQGREAGAKSPSRSETGFPVAVSKNMTPIAYKSVAGASLVELLHLHPASRRDAPFRRGIGEIFHLGRA